MSSPFSRANQNLRRLLASSIVKPRPMLRDEDVADPLAADPYTAGYLDSIVRCAACTSESCAGCVDAIRLDMDLDLTP